MSIATQQFMFQKDSLSFNDVHFVHNEGDKYKLIGWNTNRDEADKGKVEYSATAKLTYDKIKELWKTANSKRTAGKQTKMELELYAVWKLRNIVTYYGDLSIKAENVSYSETSTNITYSIPLISAYEGTNTEVGRTYDTGKVKSDVFSANGVYGSEIATRSRNITIEYKHAASGKTATTVITQSGYTPKYRLAVEENCYGTVQCLINGFELNPISTTTYGNKTTKTYESTTKQMTLVASSKKYVCKINGTEKIQSYVFNRWTSGSTSTASTINVNGTVVSENMNIITYSASFDLYLLPIVSNVIISKYNKTWIRTTYHYKRKIRGYDSYWVPTCNHDTKRKKKGYTTWDHEDWKGHGYWETDYSRPYYHYKLENTTTTTEYNKYYNSASLDNFKQPYEITVHSNGKLVICGKIGTDIYGKKSYSVIMHDDIVYKTTEKNNKEKVEFKIQIFNIYDGTWHDNKSFTNDIAEYSYVNFYYEFDLKANDKLRILQPYSLLRTNIEAAVKIDSIVFIAS